MGIKGTVWICKSNLVKNMEIGESGYIKLHNLLVTNKAVCLSKNEEVFYDLDLEEDEYFEDEAGRAYAMVKITRIGEALTEKDFILDFREVLKNYDENGVSVLNSNVLFFKVKKEQDCIMFYNPPIRTYGEYYPYEDNTPNETLDDLQEQLRQAEHEERYEDARRIKDQIVSFLRVNK